MPRTNFSKEISLPWDQQFYLPHIRCPMPCLLFRAKHLKFGDRLHRTFEVSDPIAFIQTSSQGLTDIEPPPAHPSCIFTVTLFPNFLCLHNLTKAEPFFTFTSTSATHFQWVRVPFPRSHWECGPSPFQQSGCPGWHCETRAGNFLWNTGPCGGPSIARCRSFIIDGTSHPTAEWEYLHKPLYWGARTHCYYQHML